MVGSGIGNKISEAVDPGGATIYPKSDMILVAATTNIATIAPLPNGGFASMLIIVPTAGATATLTTGNIAAAVTMPQNRATVLVYSKINNKYYPGAIS